MSSKPRFGFINRVLRLFGVQARSVFAAARVDRLTMDWVMSPLSANQEIRQDLMRARARARALVRDNAFARRFVNLMAQNVVGPFGIRMRARTTSTTGDLKEKTNTQIEAAWRDWCRPGNCTVDGRLSFTELCQGVARGIPMDGEALLYIRRGMGPYGVQVQALDPDLLDYTYNAEIDPATGIRIVMGVEQNQDGRPLAYWLWKYHPAEASTAQKRVRVDANDIIHLAPQIRVNQTRGMTWFAPIMMALRHLDGYIEAAVVSARIAASTMGFFSADPEHAQVSNTTPPIGAVPMSVEPGMMKELPPGYTVQKFDAAQPTVLFDSFVSAILRMVAMGLNISYTSLSGDLSKANYSSARVGMLDERDGYKVFQQYLIDHLCHRLFVEWLTSAVMFGMVSLPSGDVKRWSDVEWRPRGYAWIDPLKDVQASILAVQNGLDSRTAVAAEEGEDIEDVFDNLANEKAYADKKGIILDTAPPVKPTPMGGPPAASDSTGKADGGKNDGGKK